MPALPLVFVGLLVATVSAVELPEHLRRGWDEEVGLWRGSTKRGPEGHDIRANAGKLLQVACLGLLDEVPAGRILGTIRRAQATSGELRGNFWWAWEDKKVTDRNSGFFTTIQLLALHHEFRDQLDEVARGDLEAMLREAVHWFAHKVEPPTPDKLRYPNAFLGDAVCLWLLREIVGGSDDPAWRERFHGILAWYRDHDWGWGEHLSDLYGKICQRELAALLLWAGDLDEGSRALARDLLTELVRLDEQFAGGPRVPTIRCYWLDRSPRTPQSWPHWFHPWTTLLDAAAPIGEFTIEHLAARRGLFADLAVAPSPAGDRRVPCFGGRTAHAWVAEGWRYGTMSDYPLFPDTNDHQGYGLHWQSMPVAFWHQQGDWAYLQWLAEEDGAIRGQPALARSPKASCRLSDRDAEARSGRTRGLRHGQALLVHRELPVARSWSWCGDRWRWLAPTATATTDEVAGWHRLLLRFEDGVLTVAWRGLQEGLVPEASLDGDDRAFGWRRLAPSEGGTGRLRAVWFLHMADDASEPPHLDSDGDSLRARFTDGSSWLLEGDRPWSLLAEGPTGER